jgi:GH43 family beta-xylosidase
MGRRPVVVGGHRSDGHLADGGRLESNGKIPHGTSDDRSRADVYELDEPRQRSREEYRDDPFNGKPYPAGDPFVLRFNGRYYLYPSTRGKLANVRAWSSEDLIHWKYEGLVAEGELVSNAYAPEVVYWNGYFYMYLSQQKQGHRALVSESPTGPFVVRNGEMGMTIDGSVFIDDDARWYFYHAGFQGIRGHEMPNPFEVGPEKVLEGTSLNHWTEGPMVIKRNGTYFMTFTGNHLESKGYRINYAISKEGPLGKYVAPYNNPIIIHTEDGFHGLGHSSTVLGPDLDSYYIVYHNNKQEPPGHYRELNIDKLAFNGDKMTVLGPTNFPQPVPKKADFFTWIQSEGRSALWEESADAGMWRLVSKRSTANHYTAEFNFRVDPSTWKDGEGTVGVLFSYRDARQFAWTAVDLRSKKLELYRVEDGVETSLGSAQLPPEFDFTKLHTIRVEKGPSRTKVFFDGMRKLDVESAGLAGGKIGYVSRAVSLLPDYTAFSNEVDGSADFDAFKPVPGGIEAVHYLKGENRGYHVAEAGDDKPGKPGESGKSGEPGETGELGRPGEPGKLGESGDNPYRPQDRVNIEKHTDNTYLVNLSGKGDWLKYHINVKETARYGLDFRVKDQTADAVVEFYVDDRYAGKFTVPAAPNGQPQDWVRVKVGELQLEKSFHTFQLKLVRGKLKLLNFELYEVSAEKFNRTYALSKELLADWRYFGKWTATERGHAADPAANVMAFTGNSAWTDYTLEADVTLLSVPSLKDGGLLVRATMESEHRDQVADSMIGYYVALSSGKITLKKLNYGATVLKQAEFPFQFNRIYRIAVRVEGSTIRVYVDGAKTPIIEYTDSDAFPTGKIGLRSANADMRFDNVTVKSL